MQTLAFKYYFVFLQLFRYYLLILIFNLLTKYVTYFLNLVKGNMQPNFCISVLQFLVYHWLTYMLIQGMG